MPDSNGESVSNGESETPPMPSRRVWGFRLASIVVALLPFIAAELYLRATARVDSADLTVDPIFDTNTQTRLFVRSQDGNRMMIPDSRLNFFRPASFAASKPDAVRRVFVLGGSTVQGRPYETETAFSTWTQLRLASSDRSHPYEVVNCGGVSYASYRIAVILEEVLSYAPDAIVIYTGHNEYLEERSYDTTASSAAPLQKLAQHSHLIRSIRDRIQHRETPRQDLPTDLRTRLDLVDGMQRYVRDQAWRAGVVDHFHHTLDRMIRSCQARGIPLVLCLPTGDLLRTAPFKVMEADLDENNSNAFRLQWSTAQNPDLKDEDRIQACEACLRIDPQHAGAHFLVGQLFWKLKQTNKAREHLIAARDHDVCPLRATTPILNAIQSLADQHNLELIRCDDLMDQLDGDGRRLPDGIPDPKRFVDHIHPTIAGHQEIARAVSDQLMAIFHITADESAQTEYESRAAEHLSSLDESYFLRGKQRLEGLLNWAAGRAGKYEVEAAALPAQRTSE